APRAARGQPARRRRRPARDGCRVARRPRAAVQLRERGDQHRADRGRCDRGARDRGRDRARRGRERGAGVAGGAARDRGCPPGRVTMRLLPFDYAVRNLARRPVRTALGIAGNALVVLLVLAAGAFVRGMVRALEVTADEHNVILLGAGSEESIERSEIGAGVATVVAGSVRGIKNRAGVDFVSPEIQMALAVRTAADDPEERL